MRQAGAPRGVLSLIDDPRQSCGCLSKAAILFLTALTHAAQCSDSALRLRVQPKCLLWGRQGAFVRILGKLFRLTINSAEQLRLPAFDLSLLLRQIDSRNHSAGFVWAN